MGAPDAAAAGLTTAATDLQVLGASGALCRYALDGKGLVNANAQRIAVFASTDDSATVGGGHLTHVTCWPTHKHLSRLGGAVPIAMGTATT